VTERRRELRRGRLERAALWNTGGRFGVCAGSLLSVEHLSVADVAWILAMTARLEQMDAAERRGCWWANGCAAFLRVEHTDADVVRAGGQVAGATTTLVSDKSSSIEKARA